MTSAFPGGLDSFTNPTGASNQGTAVGGRTHSAMHADINDAVEAVQSALGVNLAKARGANVFDAVAYGAVVDGSTNDTAAWQAAINACAAAGGGVVTSSKAGVSVIAGALQDTGGANAQLTLPDVHMLDAQQMGIEIRGPWEQSAVCSVVGAAVTPTTGLVLKSTLASGSGAVIGGYGSGTSYQHFTFVNLTLRNLTVRTVANPTITAVDLRKVDSCTLDAVIIDTGQFSTALTEPTTSTSFGLRLPGINNGANVNLRKVSVFGFYNGVEHSEHASFNDVSVGATKVAITAVAANHASHYRRVLVSYYATGLKITGTHYLDVEQWAVEHASSGWMSTTYDVDDASNLGAGFIRWAAVAQGVGPHNSFVVNGGSGITTSRVGAALGTGGGTTVYEYRDRLTAATGDGVLTLGASPVTNSPDVWVNGAMKWPGTDYTISGAVITLGTALTSGDIVTAHYRSTTSSYTTAGLTAAAVNIVDTFTRADSTSVLGSTTTGSKAWTSDTGTWGITSNKAYCSNGVAGIVVRATIASGVSNGTVAVTLTDAGGGSTTPSGLVVRSDGSGNYYLIETQVGTAYTPKIYKGTASSNSVIATGSSTTVAAGSVLSVVLSGSSITVKDDGVTIVSVTDSTWNANTRHGLYTQAPNGGQSQIRFDDFSVQP